MTTTVDELVKALRCTNDVTGTMKADCKKCKWCHRCTEEEIEEFCTKHKVNRSDYPEDFWEGCDCERIGLEASDTLEMLQNALKDLINKTEED